MKQGATPENVKSWQDWNVAMKKLYTTTIQDGGPYEFEGKPHKTGYWDNDDATCKLGGRTMSTCLAALQLMVYYRYLPTTQADKGNGDAGETKKPRANNDVKVDVEI